MYLGDHTAHGDGPGGAPGEAVRVHYVAVDEAGKHNRGIGIDDDYLSKQAPGICYGRATVLLVHHVRQVVVVLQGQLRVEVSCNNAICNTLLQLYWVLYFFCSLHFAVWSCTLLVLWHSTPQLTSVPLGELQVLPLDAAGEEEVGLLLLGNVLYGHGGG